MPGFIHDKLEIRVLILYIAARLEEPVPMDTLLDLSLCDDGVGYFDFIDCLYSLVETGHLERDDAGLYRITEKGRRNGDACETDVAKSVRIKCDRNVAECNRALRRKRQVRSRWEPRPNGTYSLFLALDDDFGNLMDMKLMIPREDMARILSEHFQRSPEDVYHRFLTLLLDSFREWQRAENEKAGTPSPYPTAGGNIGKDGT